MSGPVFLAVDVSSADLTVDDRVLAEALVAAGREVVPVVWGRPIPPRSTLVVRSTWDYVEDPARFLGWLAQLDADGVDVLNPTPLLGWNLHKRYLVEMQALGVSIVPTVVVPCGRAVDLTELVMSAGWNDAVVKPAIGGSSRLTMHVGDRPAHDAQRHLDRIVTAGDALVQRFVPSVRSTGETSVIVLGGVVSHAVRKTVADGDWRVRSEFGGDARLVPVDDRLASTAQLAVEAVGTTPLYARVDLVEGHDGDLQVMELELVEPELFFRLAPHAGPRIAELLAARPPYADHG